MQYTHLCKGVLLKLLLFIMHHCSNDIRFNYCNFISNNASSAVYFPSSKLSWVMWSESHSVLSSAFWPHGLEPARLLCPWNSPGKNPGVGCHALLQGIFPTHGLSPHLLGLLHWQVGSLLVVPQRVRRNRATKQTRPEKSDRHKSIKIELTII